jgi:TonB family protein
MWAGGDASPGQGQAVVVHTLFRGIGTDTRVLSTPREVQRAKTATPMLATGAALCLLALVLFTAVALDLAAERRALTTWATSGHSPAAFVGKPHSGLLDVAFVGSLLSGGILLAWGLHRRRSRPRSGAADFVVGSSAGVDAPVDEHYVSSPHHRLVTTVGDSPVVHTTPQMTGEFTVAGEIFPLDELIRQRGSTLRLPAGGRARLTCGEMTFLVAATDAPAALPRPLLRWRPERDPYTLGAVLALGLFLLMVFTVPPDPRSLSLDLLDGERHLIQFRIAPPVEDVKLTPSELPGATAAAGKAGKAHIGEAGAMGDKNARARDRHFASKGPPENRDLRLAKETAIENARTAGILGVFKRMDGPVASIFARDSALGKDAEDVLGNLVGTQVGSAWGPGGLGAHGTGAGGGGTGEATLGVGHLGTIGSGTGADGDGTGGYGHLAGVLHSRRPKVPEVLPGIASVRGTLDKEIIRRTIRRHINEIKFCYEQELTKRPNLSGRIMVQFAIAGTGQVISSVLQSSTIGNAQVENCAVQAVRRWSFPQPQGGGLVMVTYPFVLAPAG